MSERSKARWALLGAAALFSTGGAAIKGTSFGGLELAGLRSAVAVLAFLAFLPGARSVPSPRALLVSVAYASTLIAFVIANKLTTSALAIFLQSSAPIYVLLLAPLLLKERVRSRDCLFLLLIGAGVLCLFQDHPPAQATSRDPALGNQLGLYSGFAWALTMIGLRWLGREGGSSARSLEAVVAGNALAAIGCLALAGTRGELTLASADATSWLLVLYLGVFQIGLAYTLVTRAVRHVEAFEVSVLLLVEPVLNPLWAFLFQGERPGLWANLGGAIILGATLAKSWWDARVESRRAQRA